MTLTAPSSAARCSEIEVVVNSTLKMGHESVTLMASGGVNLLRGWSDKCGWNNNMCSLTGWGIGEWNPAIGYWGPLHFVLEITGTSDVQLWVRWDDGNVGPPIYNTTPHTVTVTPGPSTSAVYVSTKDSSLAAGGERSTPVYVRTRTASCGAIKGATGTLSTTLGSLSVAPPGGSSSIDFTTDTKGTAVRWLTSSTVPGIATITGRSPGLTSGSTTVKMQGYTLKLTAEPDSLPANGRTSSLLTATLEDPSSGPVAGETIQFTTDKGTLVVTPGSAGSTSVSATTGALGTAMAILTSSTTPEKATVTANFTSGSISATATTAVTFDAYTLAITGATSEYRNVPGEAGGAGLSAQGGIVASGGAITRWGETKVSVTVKLARGKSATALDVGNKTINLKSPERDLFGSSFISMQSGGVEINSVTTNPTGEAYFDLVTRNLWQVALPDAAITVNAEFAEDPTITAVADIATYGNMQMVVNLYATSVPSGPVLSADTLATVRDRLGPGALVPFDAVAEWPGLQNDRLVASVYDAVVDPAWNARFLEYTAPHYQWKVLSFLHALQWGASLTGGGGGSADNRWMLNGLDWAPLFVAGGTHLAVVLYPRTNDGTTPAEWRSEEARILDPWLNQRPTTYQWNEWLDILAHRLPDAVRSSEVQTREFVDGQFGGSGSPSHMYPANRPAAGVMGNYYPSWQTVPAPSGSWIEGLRSGWWVDTTCPVYVTLIDAQNRRSGHVSSSGSNDLVDEVPGVVRTRLKKEDGTLLWSFTAPSGATTLRIEAYGTGPVTTSVVRPDLGKIWLWDTTVTQGDIGTLVFDPTSTTPPVLTFVGGRTVAGVASPVLATGVTPSTGLLKGGTQVAITGIDVQSGATVTIGGEAATNVQFVNGTTLTATTPRGSAGAAAVVVTNPGGAQTTLTGAFTYDYARVYFAEGATGTAVDFDTSIALLNPDATLDAGVHLRFLKSDGTSATHDVTVPAMGRRTVDAAAALGAGTNEFATVVEADTPVVADRTMVWDASGYGSHTETGVASPAIRWYLAEGATHSNFDLFYTLQNATDTAAQVQVTYLRPSPLAPVLRSHTVGPHSRYNIWVDQDGADLASTEVSAVIDVTNQVPIVVERSMYLSTGGCSFAAGHESAGVTQPATRWFLAEGATGSYFDLFVLVANPGTTAAQVRATYLLPDGTTHAKDYSVDPQSRFNIWVDLEEIPAGSGLQPLADTAVSTIVESLNGVQIIVERAMWWPGPTSATWTEAHNSPGATTTGTVWALAEGEQGGARGVETYILVANASPRAGDVKVTLVFEDGARAERTFQVAASGRFNVDLPAHFPGEFPPGASRRFGAVVESVGTTPIDIVVERAMYSNASGVRWAAGTNSRATRLR